MARKLVLVSGSVQGVGYRASAYDKAVQLGLEGWIRNRSDGSVEALVEGEDAAVAEFVEWCKRGPRSAHVVGVDAQDDASLEPLSGFEVRPTL